MFSPSISGDSEISESYINSKSAIRVSICLKRYFKDVRSLCYILVMRNRRVRWLEQRLQKIFALPGSFCLRTNGHLLPSTEPLALLRSEDSIEVIPCVEVKAGVTHNMETLQSHDLVERQIQNSINSNTSLQQHDVNSPASVSNYSVTMSDDAYSNKKMRMSEENSCISNCKLQSKDKVDSADVPCQSPASSDLIINSNNKNIKEINGFNESEKCNSPLQQFKQQALSLLDEYNHPKEAIEVNAENLTPPKRTRRRVRHRTRRIPVPEQTEALDRKEQLELTVEMPLTGSSNFQTLSPELMLSDTHTLPLPFDSVVECELQLMARYQTPEVTRNESACSRKPRIVRPLGIES